MLVHAKKPLRFSSHVTTFPLIEEQENIELDSLENGDDGNISQVSIIYNSFLVLIHMLTYTAYVIKL